MLIQDIAFKFVFLCAILSIILFFLEFLLKGKRLYIVAILLISTGFIWYASEVL